MTPRYSLIHLGGIWEIILYAGWSQPFSTELNQGA
jgi:hypothetical protein